ncbi:hypothetical protein A2U01_0045647, partial [Trifolium medium]|nr:hypothetical protein [Trifolium medium]
GGAGALRAYAEKVGKLFCQSRVAQKWMARRASQLEGCFREPLSTARRAASYGASRTFIIWELLVGSSLRRRFSSRLQLHKFFEESRAILHWKDDFNNILLNSCDG